MEKISTWKHQLIQAPMAGVTTPKFVAACCEAGFFGNIGAGYLNGKQTQHFIQQVKALTNQPFGVNLFVQEESNIDVRVVQDAQKVLQPYYEALQLASGQMINLDNVFVQQVEAIIEEKVPVCSFTFGIPSAKIIDRLKAQQVFCIGTATSLQEAMAIEAAGLDAVIVQGKEAGGHRGSFTEPLPSYSTKELVEEITTHCQLPVIAAGGIISKEDKEQMLKLGATAVQIGTALIVADECEASELHKQAILQSQPGTTTLTKAFTGKFARGYKNTFTEQMAGAIVAPYPIQHYLTLPIRKASEQLGDAQYLSLWMGERCYLANRASVQTIYQSFE